jgi:hypothetical protein
MKQGFDALAGSDEEASVPLPIVIQCSPGVRGRINGYSVNQRTGGSADTSGEGINSAND